MWANLGATQIGTESKYLEVKLYDKIYDLNFLVALFNFMDRSEQIPERAKPILYDLVGKTSEHSSKRSFTGGPSDLNHVGCDQELQEQILSIMIENSGFIFLNSITVRPVGLRNEFRSHSVAQDWPGLYHAQDPQDVIRVVKRSNHIGNEYYAESYPIYLVREFISTINDDFIILPCYTPLTIALCVGGIHCDF